MSKSPSRSVRLAIYAAMVLFIGQIASTPSLAGEALSVSIGNSAMFAKKADSHDITVDALKSGQGEFNVSAGSDEAFTIRLSEKQVEDILAGSTVVVETDSGGKKVKIGPAEKKAQKSGW